MFAPDPLIRARLAAQAALAGWAVRSAAAEGSRKVVPAIEVQCMGADVEETGARAALVNGDWTIHLIVAYGDTAMDQLDTAFAAVVNALHGWTPPATGREWHPLRLTGVQLPQFSEQGLIAYSLSFTTSAIYYGE